MNDYWLDKLVGTLEQTNDQLEAIAEALDVIVRYQEAKGLK